VIARTTLGRAVALSLSFAVSQVAAPVAEAANAHLVYSNQVMNRLLAGAKSREDKVALFQKALATPEAERQARLMGTSAAKIAAAVPHLSDKELTDLSARAAKSKDVVAGHGDSAIVILGVVLLLAGIAVLVAVGDDGYYYDDCYCY
jgi:hypothetical protein